MKRKKMDSGVQWIWHKGEPQEEEKFSFFCRYFTSYLADEGDSWFDNKGDLHMQDEDFLEIIMTKKKLDSIFEFLGYKESFFEKVKGVIVSYNFSLVLKYTLLAAVIITLFWVIFT